MKGNIRQLPPELVVRIAAGEVVERPASAVKELLENSVDAGARHVTVEAERGGKGLVRVSDDGSGMVREDSIRAFDRHATSKISKLEDLFSIRTLGFRGEALASLAAVASVKLTTRPPGETEGTEVRAEGGRVLDAKAASRSVGTTVEVRDLFRDVPARRKFLRSDEVEADHVLGVVTAQALARPDIGFRAVLDGREALSLHPTESLGERVAGVYGVQVFRELVPVSGGCKLAPTTYDEYPQDACSVSGFVSRPTLTKGRPSHLFFFLNGRVFQEPLLTRAVLEAYGELLPPKRYPVGVLNLAMNPSMADVNVHPAKLVVRFADEGLVHGAVRDTVLQALSTSASQPHGVPGRPLEPLPFKPRAPSRVEARAVQKTIYGVEAPPPPPPPEPDKGLPEVVIMGQAHELYIVGQTREGLVIMDQHAAAERVNYERLRDDYAGRKVKGQTLLQPRAVELSARERRALEAGSETIARLGYQVEDFGGKSSVVKAVPVVGGRALSVDSLHDVLGEMMDRVGRPGAVSEAQADRVLKLLACHCSVRSGEKLEAEELRELVASLYRAQNPFSCPHGRPTMIHMTVAELEKKFGRS